MRCASRICWGAWRFGVPRRWGMLAGQAVPYLMLAVGIHVFCLLNYTHYGVYTLSDFSSGDGCGEGVGDAVSEVSEDCANVFSFASSSASDF